jgi:hypothetical protein
MGTTGQMLVVYKWYAMQKGIIRSHPGGILIHMALILDIFHVNWTFCYMCLEGAQVLGLRHESRLQNLH